jgi:hypothetical protein
MKLKLNEEMLLFNEERKRKAEKRQHRKDTIKEIKQIKKRIHNSLMMSRNYCDGTHRCYRTDYSNIVALRFVGRYLTVKKLKKEIIRKEDYYRITIKYSN